MIRLYWHFQRTTVAAIFFTIITCSAFAQQSLEGILRIKVSPSLASALESNTVTNNATGEVVTGVASLDQLNRKFRVKRFSRVFRDAGKNEQRHRKYGLHLWYEIAADKSIPVSSLVQSYQSETQILKAEPVYKKAFIGSAIKSSGAEVLSKKALPALPDASNDPMLSSQWNYHNTGQTGGTPGADIKLIDAWKLETGKKEVVIAVNDGGIQTDHSDLAANMWINQGEVAGNNIDDDNNGYTDDVNGYNFVTGSGTISPHDHGTHVAGIVAAVSNNGIGVAGVAGGSGAGDGVKLMSCAVFHNDMGGDGFAEAYVYSADNGAVISQNSWGYLLPGIFEQVVLEAIDYFIAEAGKDQNGNQLGPMDGGLVIFSAGNDNVNENFYPAFYEPVLAVASTTHKDIKAQYSNFGPWIDIAAPGGETYEANNQGVLSTLPDHQYGYFMGTSMACPHVSGIAGLLLSRFGKARFRPEALRERLLRSVDDIDMLNPSYAGQLGTGRLNAALALSQSDPTPPEAITDLSIAGKDVGEITLRWTSPRDENDFLAEYDLRYSTSPITATNFNTANQAAGIPTPKAAGTPETFTVENLPGGVLFYFAIRSADFEGNVSPMSNVVSETSALAPAIVVTPGALTEDLRTAERSTKTFTITNEGLGPLNFVLWERFEDRDFASAIPQQGSLSPEASKVITVNFDASGLFSGTYQQEIVIECNDPEKNTVIVPLSLTVEDIGVPIASVEPASIDFKSVQIGTLLTRAVTVFNKGSDPLNIREVISDNQEFTTDFPETIRIQPFSNAEILIFYSPARTGASYGEISIATSDPANPTLKVRVEGEGLEEPPVVMTPNMFDETLNQGTSDTRTMVLRNNGSADRSFRIEVRNRRLAGEEATVIARSSTSGRVSLDNDTLAAMLARRREKHAAMLSVRSGKEQELLSAIGPSPVEKKQNARKSLTNMPEIRQYVTGFEEFTPGMIGEQQGWYATREWTVSDANPDRGSQHFRGVSNASGTGEKFALSPYLFEYEEWELYPRYTTATMRLNVDKAKGTCWQVVPQDPWSYVATRVRFNTDGTIDALVVNNDYSSHWARVPATIPSGYFDLAIECNNQGNDTTSFSVYSIFIDNEYVFSGTSITNGIAQVAFVSLMETSGPVLEVDELKIIGNEFIPPFMQTYPTEGVIPAGESINVSVRFDASIVKFGTYYADVVAYLDEHDSLMAPATMTVTGEAAITHDTYYVGMEVNKGERGRANITLTNTGGRVVEYEIGLKTGIPGVAITPQQGSLQIREKAVIAVDFNGPPGIYESQILLRTDIEDYPVQPIFLKIIAFDSGAVFQAPAEVEFDMMAGEISSGTIQISNEGYNTVAFVADSSHLPGWLSIDPPRATIADTPLNMILTFDGRGLSPGTFTPGFSVETNDINRRSQRILITVNVLPDTVRGGKILRDVWTGIPGKEISAIPVTRQPDSTRFLNSFESPQNTGNNYGSRIHGYVQAPESGYYTFWIASNDNSELWLSTDETESNKQKIATVTGYTNPRQWDKYPAQKSAQVYLQQHYKYYIEALHKEGVGTDHVAVGWQMSDQTYERPIPGRRLFPYGAETISGPPDVTFLSPAEGAVFPAPATIEMKADAIDEDGRVVKVEFFNGAEKVGADIAAPYVLVWKDVAAGRYSLMVKATDNSGATDTATVNVEVEEGRPCDDAGYITREQWSNVPGTLISSIPLSKQPSVTETLTSFQTPASIGDNYGTRIRGFLCVPASGEYTFWISSNDKSELWLSTDSSPANKKKVAYVSGYTDVHQWTKYPSQQSVSIDLLAGQKYYIEALHKEGVGTDHVAVGWQLPNGKFERPVPGIRLLPFAPADNQLPIVQITAPTDGENFFLPATVGIAAEATDPDGLISKVEFFNGQIKLGEDASPPYTCDWTNMPVGSYQLTAIATDNEGAIQNSPPVYIVVDALCRASGTISREYWTGISRNLVEYIPVNTPPDGIEALTLFEGPQNAGINYGARMSGYICPPQTGDYYFWISSNDHSELWLSTDADPKNRNRIAFVTGATDMRQWNKFGSQRSMAIHLIRGKTYYIEALHKQGVGTDHVAVGWQLPDGSLERPITGDHLSPAMTSATPMATVGEASVVTSTNTAAEKGPPRLRLYPNPLKGGKLNIYFENLFLTEDVVRKIEIRQLTGSSVFSQEISCDGNCDTEIPISENLPSGVYFIQVRIHGRTYTEKLWIP